MSDDQPTRLERWRDVSVIEKRHTPVVVGGGKDRMTVCSRCEELWKCDAARMVEHLAALGEDATDD